MAIDYAYLLDTSLTPSGMAELLKSVAHLRLLPDREGKPPVLIGKGIICHVNPTSSLRQELMRETFGFDATILVSCRLDKFDLYPKGEATLTAIGVELLSSLPSDLVFQRDFPRTLLLRRSGRIAIEYRETLWTDIWRTALGRRDIPFEERELPSM